MTDCDLDFDFPPDTTGETCTATDHPLLPPPPRKVPLRIRWHLRFNPVFAVLAGCFFVICFGHRYIRLAGVMAIGLLLFLFVCLYAESGRLIDRHRAGWDDKSFQQGDIVPLEKYQYSNGIFRVMGTRAFPSNWLCFFFCFCMTGGLIACWLSASKSIEKLRSYEVTTVRLTGSETVEGKRQDSYQFTVGDNVMTRTVLKPESEPVLDKKILFYDSLKPESSTFLDDICTSHRIENGRMNFLVLAEYVWGILLIALFYPLSLAMITLTILAPYLPF